MKEELEKWMSDYKKEEKELLEKYPLGDERFSNNHPINKLKKKYTEMKIEIIMKYGTH